MKLDSATLSFRAGKINHLITTALLSGLRSPVLHSLTPCQCSWNKLKSTNLQARAYADHSSSVKRYSDLNCITPPHSEGNFLFNCISVESPVWTQNSIGVEHLNRFDPSNIKALVTGHGQSFKWSKNLFTKDPKIEKKNVSEGKSSGNLETNVIIWGHSGIAVTEGTKSLFDDKLPNASWIHYK